MAETRRTPMPRDLMRRSRATDSDGRNWLQRILRSWAPNRPMKNAGECQSFTCNEGKLRNADAKPFFIGLLVVACYAFFLCLAMSSRTSGTNSLGTAIIVPEESSCAASSSATASSSDWDS